MTWDDWERRETGYWDIPARCDHCGRPLDVDQDYNLYCSHCEEKQADD